MGEVEDTDDSWNEQVTSCIRRGIARFAKSNAPMVALLVDALYPAIGQQLSGGATALPAAMQSASLPQPASPQTLQPPQALGAAQPGAGQPPPAAGPSQSSKGLPMSVLLEVIQQHPNLKSRIQEIVSRTDYSEPEKMAAIQRIVREKSPGATLGGSSSGTPPPP